MKIVLSGGGTLGPVTPLLALVHELRARGEHEFLWMGTNKGIEKALVEDSSIPFRSIASGKIRRYFDWGYLWDPLRIMVGLIQSFFILIRFRPDRVLTSGGYVAVPVVCAAYCLRIPILVHQQDMVWGLANRIMRPLATWITVNFDASWKMLPARYRCKSHLVGNPVRPLIQSILSEPRDRALILKKFNLEEGIPIILSLGGGTGALRLNELLTQAAIGLVQNAQIIHLTGKGKQILVPELHFPTRYHHCDFFLNEMADALYIADIVISRAGTGTLTELAVLGKPTIIIPIPKSQQEANAQYFEEKNAAMVLDQEKLSPLQLASAVEELLKNNDLRTTLSQRIQLLANRDAAKEMVDILL